MKALPDKISELLKLAMIDLEKVEADPRYKVDMLEWHTPRENKCEVCLAGSVLAKSLKIDFKQRYYGLNLSEKIDDKLETINSLRMGHFYSVLGRIKLDLFSLPESYASILEMDHLSKYYREKWKLHMATIIGILVAEGL